MNPFVAVGVVPRVVRSEPNFCCGTLTDPFLAQVDVGESCCGRVTGAVVGAGRCQVTDFLIIGLGSPGLASLIGAGIRVLVGGWSLASCAFRILNFMFQSP